MASKDAPAGSIIGKIKRSPAWLPVAGLVVAGLAGFLIGSRHPSPQEHRFTITAHRYGYLPSVLRVNKGDSVKLSFISEDVVHGFYLEGYDLDVTILPLRSEVEVSHPSLPQAAPEHLREVSFIADHQGKFRYRCSHTCGFMHPFMLGELIVGPNRLLPTSVGMVFGLLAGWVAVLARKRA